MAFSVGQKVVCVDTKPFLSGYGPVPLVEGTIYTIARFHLKDQSAVQLIERTPATDDEYYGLWRFRPVTDRKTDISIFKRMLTPKKARERA